MDFEWDEAKRQRTLRERGLDFADIELLLNRFHLIKVDDRLEYGEERINILGSLHGRIVAVTYTERNDTVRVISMRKATKYEQQEFYTSLGD